MKSVDGFSCRMMLGSMSQRFVVIMAGGKGERFWPQSRLSRPKQLLPIVGEKPMLAQTIDRLEGLVPNGNIIILTNREQRDAVLDVCPGLPPENVVAEPIGRDTAAAVGLAAILVGQRDPEGTIAMLPADHVIHDAKAFQEVLGAAFAAAESGPRLVTIGLKPTFPSSGFGYVQQGGVESKAGGRDVFSVKRFVEKPDVETAKAFLESGDYLWNAGMFVWKVSTVREGIAKHVPGLESGLKTIESGLKAGTSLDAVLEKHFPTLEKISIDFALMQKAGNVVTLEATFDWDDVGSWPAVIRHSSLDDAGNAVRGDAVILEGSGNLVVSSEGHLVSVIGCDNLVVINTPGATLICPKDEAEKVKEVVKQIGAEERFRHLL
jgi:mannose-1-phosphate guanylyltransferase